MTATAYAMLPSPLGELLLTASDDGLTRVALPTEGHAPPRDAVDDEDRLSEARRQLAEYFAGTRTAFTLRLAARGTSFQRRVWEALAAIPYGTTITYAELARRASTSSARAAGAANGANPLAIIVPCHRVVGTSGHLTGYAGGLEAKRFLIDLEARR